jgi:hypothetical protein
MRSTNINTHSERSFDLVIDGSSLYDLTIDHNLNDIDMNSIFNKTLSTSCLMVDADVSGKTFNYIRHVEDYTQVTSLIPTVDEPQSTFFQYQWAVPSGYTMFEDRLKSGWSAEFITDFNETLTHTGDTQNIFFYMGKTMNLPGQESGLTDNNLVVYVKNGKLIVKQTQYERSCDCDEATDVVTVKLTRSELQLPSGSTKHHLVLVFKRDISLSEEDLKYKGANLDCTGSPNNHWYDGAKYRKGSLKVYLDGLLRETLSLDETIFRDTEDDRPHVQGWGLGDEIMYDLSGDYGLAGSYLGEILRGRFYACPLRGDEIRTNYEILSEEYNLTNTLTSC